MRNQSLPRTLGACRPRDRRFPSWRRSSFPLLVIALASAAAGFGPTSSLAQGLRGPADHWVATDALGRKLPTAAATGPPRQDRFVGIFYFLWCGHHADRVYDVTKILATGKPEQHWGPVGATHFWGEPEYGYFHSSDPWVLRRDMQMLANANVDFLYLDVTNQLLYEETIEALLKTVESMRAQGIPAPKIVFTTNSRSGHTINQIYHRFYGGGKHAEAWFHWEGKPLILGQPDDPELEAEAKNHFTIKYSWAWTDTRNQPNHWQWIDTYPQDYGWSRAPDDPDQIPVAVASHATNSIGRSFHQGNQPQVGPDYRTELTERGLHFEEQWQRAHQVDPRVVMITGWNEWIAMRFLKPDQPPVFAGRPKLPDGTWFVDEFSAEFSRDIAPMRGGHSDNYYYQMVGHIRRFKGMSPSPPRPKPVPITIDGLFDDWQNVSANYQDSIGDTQHRNFRGTDPATTLTHDFGRNDILDCAVVESDQGVNFLVSSVGVLTAREDGNWMVLLINSDQDAETGWQGYDWLVNRHATADLGVSVERWQGEKWVPSGDAPCAARDKHLELFVSNDVLDREPGDGFDFKWGDNVSLSSIESFFLEGDVAPDRRFNFRY